MTRQRESGWGQAEESFPDRGNSMYKSPEVEKQKEG